MLKGSQVYPQEYASPIFFMPPLISSNEEFRFITRDIIPDITEKLIISNYGRVYNVYTRQFVKGFIDNTGYRKIGFVIRNPDGSFYDRKYLVHRLVMMVFNPVPNMDQLQVNHIDMNRLNNALWNLEWCTAQENMQARFNTKGYSFSSEPRLSEDQVRLICSKFSEGYSAKEVTEYVLKLGWQNISFGIIAGIKKRRTYTDISKDYTWEAQCAPKLTEQQVRMICEEFVKGLKPMDVLRKYPSLNVKKNTLSEIYRRNHWKNVVKDYPDWSQYSRYQITEDQVRFICQKFSEGYGVTEVYRMFDNPSFNMETVRKIHTRAAWTRISKDYEWKYVKNRINGFNQDNK